MATLLTSGCGSRRVGTVGLARRLMSTGQRASLSRPRLPPVKNEPFLDYDKNSSERVKLKAALKQMRKDCPEIPAVVGGKEVKTGKISKQVMPSEHSHAVCTYHSIDRAVADEAIKAALAAKPKWESMPFEDRAAIFLRAADLLSTKYRAELCAATMLGAGKNVWQAEIDAGVETIDFWRFGPSFVQQIYEMQPPEQAAHVWNRMEYRPLEGFVVAITPFNFTAIGANLPSTPALVGNTVIWKPSTTNMLASWLVFKILKEAGLPDGVINFLPGHGPPVGDAAFGHPDFAGLHFTGSTNTFNTIWRTIANNIDRYRSYPRIVGETGGKNFHFAHKSADVTHFVVNTIRAAFEYQGQKCSACSRAYIPDNLWPQMREMFMNEWLTIKMGQPDEFDTFVSAVIDQRSFQKIVKYIEDAKSSPACQILAGGRYDNSVGYFIEPTIIVTKDPHYITMREEIFGPVLTIYVYKAEEYEEMLKVCDSTTPYALTGSLFAEDRYALELGSNMLRHSAGNFYLNDKSTGAIVGQQPFGGSRASGTNDKSGSLLNYLRWVSARSIKEGFLRASSYKYPHML